MKEKVFKSIYNLITRGQIQPEEAYYLLELLFKENRDPIYIPYTHTEQPLTTTWTGGPYTITTTGGNGIKINNTGDDVINPWWSEKDSSTGLPNNVVYTSATTNSNGSIDAISTATINPESITYTATATSEKDTQFC